MRTEKPEISIIIPVYNGEKYLDKCLGSIIGMNYSDWECIVVDDGSIDSSLGKMMAYSIVDPRIRVVPKPNGGASSARNAGIANARGKWITFVDVDDSVSKDYCDSLCEETANNVDMIILQSRQNNSPKITSYSRWGLISNQNGVKALINENMRDDIFRCPFGKIIRSEIVYERNLRFDERLSYGEDTIFNLQAFDSCKSIYCTHKGTYSFSTSEKLYPAKKYKISPESLLLFDREFGEYFLKKGYENKEYERLMFRNFTILEQIASIYKDARRKDFYTDPVQLELKRRRLDGFRFYQRWVYDICEKTPDGEGWQTLRKWLTK